MFALEIVAKLIEGLLGDLGKKIISRGSDPKRKFAKDLLACYQAIKDYRVLSSDLLEVMKKRRETTSDSRGRYKISEVQRISDRMAKLVGTIFGKFSIHELWPEIYKEAPDEKARKKYEVLEVFDAKLAALLKHSMNSDIWIAEIASQLSRVKADWYTQQIILLNPNTTEIPEALNAYSEAIELVRWGKTLDISALSKHLKVIRFTDNDDLDFVIRKLHENIVLIDKTIEGMSNFMRSNFVLEDLL